MCLPVAASLMALRVERRAHWAWAGQPMDDVPSNAVALAAIAQEIAFEIRHHGRAAAVYLVPLSRAARAMWARLCGSQHADAYRRFLAHRAAITAGALAFYCFMATVLVLLPSVAVARQGGPLSVAELLSVAASSEAATALYVRAFMPHYRAVASGLACALLGLASAVCAWPATFRLPRSAGVPPFVPPALVFLVFILGACLRAKRSCGRMLCRSKRSSPYCSQLTCSLRDQRVHGGARHARLDRVRRHRVGGVAPAAHHGGRQKRRDARIHHLHGRDARPLAAHGTHQCVLSPIPKPNLAG